jgi:hypothetical protein
MASRKEQAMSHTPAMDERQAFEALMARLGYHLEPATYRDGTYRDTEYSAGWAVWQAARAASPNLNDKAVQKRLVEQWGLAASPVPTDEQIIAIRDEHLPSQGEAFDCLAFARAVLAASPPAPPTPQPAAQPLTGWQPIETAPPHVRALLYAPPEALFEKPEGKSGQHFVASFPARPAAPASAPVAGRLSDPARIAGCWAFGDSCSCFNEAGARVLLARQACMQAASSFDGAVKWQVSPANWTWATHWMPLPAPPSQEGETPMTDGEPLEWSGAVPFLTMAQNVAGIEDEKPWGDEFLAWYEEDRWFGEHRGCAVFVGMKIRAIRSQ